MKPQTKIVNREAVIAAFGELPPGSATTTKRIAIRTGYSERQIRACISWLVMGGQLIYAGKVNRRDSEDRLYPVKIYQWTGKTEIYRVPQNEAERRSVTELRSSSAIDTFLKGKRR
jgi:hypothetical protein